MLGRLDLGFLLNLNEIDTELKEAVKGFYHAYSNVRRCEDGGVYEKLRNLLEKIERFSKRPDKIVFIGGFGSPEGFFVKRNTKISFKRQAEVVLVWLILFLEDKKSFLKPAVIEFAEKNFPEALKLADMIISLKNECKERELPVFFAVRFWDEDKLF